MRSVTNASDGMVTVGLIECRCTKDEEDKEDEEVVEKMVYRLVERVRLPRTYQYRREL